MITQETIKGLEQIHRKIMRIRDPGMETYSILLHDLVPLLKDAPPLYDEFIRRKDIRPSPPDPNVLMDDWVLNLAGDFKFVFDLLYDREHRMEYLGSEEKLFETQQIIDVVLKVLLHFANERIAKMIPLQAAQKTDRGIQAEFISGHIRVGERSCKIRANVNVTHFCERMFNKTKVDDSVHWLKVHEFVYERRGAAKPTEWRKIYNLVQRVNAVTRKNGMGEMLSFAGGSDGKVTRLQ